MEKKEVRREGGRKAPGADFLRQLKLTKHWSKRESLKMPSAVAAIWNKNLLQGGKSITFIWLRMSFCP